MSNFMGGGTDHRRLLPVLGGRRTYNDERDCPAAALAVDKLGADYRLFSESSGQYASGGQHGRRVGSGADGGADAETHARGMCADRRRKQQFYHQYRIFWQFRRRIHDFQLEWRRTRTNYYGEHRQQPTHAHREQVHSLLYVEAHQLIQKGVAV